MSQGKGWGMPRVVALLLAMLTLIYALFIPEEWMREQLLLERQAAQVYLGQEAGHKVERRALRWFNAAFVSTGLVRGSYRMVHGEPDDGEDMEEINERVGGVLDWTRSRVNVVWMMLLQLCMRLSVSGIWAPFVSVVLLPFLVDAMVVRKIKASSFGLTSPHSFHYARLLLVATPAAFLLLLFAPWQMPGVAPPIAGVLFAMALWNALAQFAKKA